MLTQWKGEKKMVNFPNWKEKIASKGSREEGKGRSASLVPAKIKRSSQASP